MDLTLVDEGGVAVLEGQDATPFITGAGDARAILEACFAQGVRSVLLYAPNLPASFFDLSSGPMSSTLSPRAFSYTFSFALARPGAQRVSPMPLKKV
jgi:hypothetical protein